MRRMGHVSVCDVVRCVEDVGFWLRWWWTVRLAVKGWLLWWWTVRLAVEGWLLLWWWVRVVEGGVRAAGAAWWRRVVGVLFFIVVSAVVVVVGVGGVRVVTALVEGELHG